MVATGRCRISTLELPRYEIKGPHAEWPAGVLAQWTTQCPATSHLDLSGNYNFGAEGAESLAGVLAQCTALAHLNHRGSMESKLSGKGGFELRDVVKPLVFFCRHLALRS